ncbi:VOC family protein [Streptomyces sp. Rer75]|uniref:VOC family protein n=1 Tax=Streptomyces sp. Rer75 TaxID=2750011 RepID=UPI0015D09C83|nr:VOC family protein [Streptomyces sp. Rer75]QLH23766.1 VOC family protein [Streptomyces sp. Rer75]
MTATDAKGTRLTEIGRVAITVADQDRALDFYVNTLGFEKRADIPYGDSYRWIEVAPAGAPTGIALVLPREGQQASAYETGLILTSEDIDADHATLRARGVDTDPEVQRWGAPVPPMFSFRDADGNALMVVENG